MLKLTVLDLSTRPASSLDSSVDACWRLRPCRRRPRRDRRPDTRRTGRCLSLAVAAVAFCSVNSHAQTLTIGDASADEGDGITFTVTLDKAVPLDHTASFHVDPTFTGGTATKNTDYEPYEESLVFAGTAGETQTFTVNTTEDATVEPDETFTVSLTVTKTSETITATDTATGTIRNDDIAPALTIGDASADEGDGITFTVTLDKAVSDGLTVTPSFTGGTATKGTDYTENTAAISFTGTAGETQTFTVATTNDAAAEPDETFTVSLAVSDTAAIVTATTPRQGRSPTTTTRR